MAKYRKKPMQIEAVQWVGNNITEVIELAQEPIKQVPNNRLEIKTLEGTMLADHGDYIIRGVQGEVYPCKPEIFRATYEPVEDN